MERKRSWPAVSHICNRTRVEVSGSNSLLVRNEAPMVDGVLWEGGVLWMKRWTVVR